MKLKPLFFYITFLLFNESLSLSNRIGLRYVGRKFNVCRQMPYYTSGATNLNECWYNPDVDSFSHDIIKRYGYPTETFKVKSNDSYYTTLFRIPRGKSEDSSNGTNERQPIFLLHGLAMSSHTMVDIGKQCLAFALSDAGYDVWLGNMRGTSYSLGHTNMTYKNGDYWKFSFHEIGKYDLPATLELISKHTNGKKIIFIGHSIAASVFHVFEAYHRNLSKHYLSGTVLIAPIVYLTDLQPPQKEFEQFGNPLRVLLSLLGVKSNYSTEMLSAKRTLVAGLPSMLKLYNNGIYLAFGLRSPNIPPHYLPLLLNHNPSGFSVKTLKHLLQISRNDGIFQEFDYGVAKNQELYDDVFPKEYDVQGCETPVYVIYSSGDWISTEADVEKLLSVIPEGKVKGKYKIKAKVWKHLDYFYGKQVKTLFYKPLLHILEQFTNDSKTVKNSPESDSVLTTNKSPLNNTSSTVEYSSEEVPTTLASTVIPETTIITKISSKMASISDLITRGTLSTLFRTKPKIIASSSTLAKSRRKFATTIMSNSDTFTKPTVSLTKRSSSTDLVTVYKLGTVSPRKPKKVSIMSTINEVFTYSTLPQNTFPKYTTLSKGISNAATFKDLSTFDPPTLFPYY